MSSPIVQGVPGLVRETRAQGAQATPAVRAETGRYEELEGLRGIAALLVVLYHVPAWNPAVHGVTLFHNGRLMVELFFVLSGFVISGAYRSRLNSPRALVDFQLLRLGRLYPVHLLFLLFFLLVEFSKSYLAARHGIESNNSQPFVQNSWTAFAQQLLLIQPIGPTGNAITFNAPAWSIGVEFYTYLVFALLVWWFPARFGAIAAGVCAASLGLLAWDGWPGFMLVFKCLAGFFLGCLVQQAAVRRLLPGSRSLLLLALVLMVAYLSVPQGGLQDLLVYPLSALLVFAIASSPDGGLRRLLRCWPMAWLGRLSYSVYMAHSAVIWVVSQVIRFAFDKPFMMTSTGRIEPQLSVFEAVTGYGVALLLTLAVAWIVHHWIEEPCRQATRRWVARRA